jgi:hypothetical protein
VKVRETDRVVSSEAGTDAVVGRHPKVKEMGGRMALVVRRPNPRALPLPDLAVLSYMMAQVPEMHCFWVFDELAHLEPSPSANYLWYYLM